MSAESIQSFLIGVCDYNFTVHQTGDYKMSRASLAVTIEIEKMIIVVAEKVPLTSILKRKGTNKFTGEKVTY